jgi:hypothetical protein
MGVSHPGPTRCAAEAQAAPAFGGLLCRAEEAWTSSGPSTPDPVVEMMDRARSWRNSAASCLDFFGSIDAWVQSCNATIPWVQSCNKPQVRYYASVSVASRHRERPKPSGAPAAPRPAATLAAAAAAAAGGAAPRRRGRAGPAGTAPSARGRTESHP